MGYIKGLTRTKDALHASLGQLISWAVRQDGRDPFVDDVAMMCHFARRMLQRMLEDEMEPGSRLESRQRVFDFITWDNMVTYWNESGGH